MEFSCRQKDQSWTTSNVDSAILNRLEDYRRSLDAALKIPETTVPLLLEKGRMLVQADLRKFEATACALMDSARHMEPMEANRFLLEQVTAETFEFQSRFDALRSFSDVNLSGVCGIHVNCVSVLANLRDSEMAPICKRFDSDWDRDSPDSYRVCFASGRIDPLSQFLVGHALLRQPRDLKGSEWLGVEKNPRTANLAEWWALEPTQQGFAEEFAIAVVEGSNLVNPEDYLDILSPVRTSSEILDFIGIMDSTRVRVERLPHTVLLPEQIAALRRESDYHIASVLAEESQTDITTFPEQYVVAAHAELVMKFRLLNVYESIVSRWAAP